jgi:hypothetical protein
MLRRFALLLATFGVLASGPASPVAQLHLSDLDGVTAGASSTAAGSPYSFTAVSQGRPIRWDPCTPIHWKYRSAGQVVGGFTQVVRAVARIARATGTTWVYDGAVSTAPTSAWLPTTTSSLPPVLIGWTTAAHSDLLRGQSPGVLGVTRTSWFSVTRGSTTTTAIRGAVLALNQSKHLPLTGPMSWYTVALHELSHAMGLGHASSARELMYPVIQPGLRDLQAGDLVGLARVGRSEGCIRL